MLVLVIISKIAEALAGTSRVDSPITETPDPVFVIMLTCQGLPLIRI